MQLLFVADRYGEGRYHAWVREIETAEEQLVAMDVVSVEWAPNGTDIVRQCVSTAVHQYVAASVRQCITSLC